MWYYMYIRLYQLRWRCVFTSLAVSPLPLTVRPSAQSRLYFKYMVQPDNTSIVRLKSYNGLFNQEEPSHGKIEWRYRGSKFYPWIRLVVKSNSTFILYGLTNWQGSMTDSTFSTIIFCLFCSGFSWRKNFMNLFQWMYNFLWVLFSLLLELICRYFNESLLNFSDGSVNWISGISSRRNRCR